MVSSRQKKKKKKKQIVSYLQKYPTELEVSDHQLTIFMQNVFSEKSTDVHRDMWPAVLLWVKQFPHGIKSIKNLHVTFLQKLFSFLRKGSGIAASSITYQSVYPLLALMGYVLLFFFRFLCYYVMQ